MLEVKKAITNKNKSLIDNIRSEIATGIMIVV